MSVLHLYISSGRFSSEEELDDFIQPSYDENGEKIDSVFMDEVGLTSFEPACIEATFEEREVNIIELLEGSSYQDQWLELVPNDLSGNVALTIYEPNLLSKPKSCSLVYVGSYNYVS
jgi:hypothetical protein